MPIPRCTLIVPVYNGLEYLRPMLESLRACTPEGAYELILSDDASDEETQAFLKDAAGCIVECRVSRETDGGMNNEGARASSPACGKGPLRPLAKPGNVVTIGKETKVLFSERNQGFAAACNAGARAASGEFLVFLNSDLEMKEGWLEAMVRAADEDPRIGAVGAKLLYPDGTIQHGGVFLREDRLDRIPLIASHDYVGRPGDDLEANRPADLLAVSAAAILVRRNAFEEVGGFDEGYFNGYEDIDLCLKLGEKGWRIVYRPEVELVHHESKSGAKRFAASKANQRMFVERWSGRVCPEVLVTPHLEVGPHPDWYLPIACFRAREKGEGATEREFRVSSEELDPRKGNVRIVVLPGGPTSALAATLEAIFAARIGLYDSVVALCEPGDEDPMAYLRLCEGYDGAFRWTEEGIEAALHGAEDFVAVVEPGTIPTQGWLSRMIPWARLEGVGACGPMMTGVSGPQDALASMPVGASGSFFPNELSHAFARQFRGRTKTVLRLEPACFLMRREALKALPDLPSLSWDHCWAQLNQSGLKLLAVEDVFVHREERYVPARRALAA